MIGLLPNIPPKPSLSDNLKDCLYFLNDRRNAVGETIHLFDDLRSAIILFIPQLSSNLEKCKTSSSTLHMYSSCSGGGKYSIDSILFPFFKIIETPLSTWSFLLQLNLRWNLEDCLLLTHLLMHCLLVKN